MISKKVFSGLTAALLAASTFTVPSLAIADEGCVGESGNERTEYQHGIGANNTGAQVTRVDLNSCEAEDQIEADGYPVPPEQSATTGHYVEVDASPANQIQPRSALGESAGPGPTMSSRVFVYVDGDGLRANYAQVGWRGDPINPTEASNVCGGEFDLQWTDADGNHQERSGAVDNCTTVLQFNWPGHYLSFDLSNETFAPNTDVCGRYRMDFGTSTWACAEMKE